MHITIEAIRIFNKQHIYQLSQSCSLPGYICAIFLIDWVGVKKLQDIGFAATAFFFFLLSILHPYLKGIPALYLLMYGITFFFQNFGPNTTTYIIPSVVFKKEQKATCHGISAAAGIVVSSIYLFN